MNVSTRGAGPQAELVKLFAEDHRRLQIGALASGLTHGEQLHVLLTLMTERVQHARDHGELTSAPGELSDLELFTLLTLRAAGLLTEPELAHAEWAARVGGPEKFAERLEGMNRLIGLNLAAEREAAKPEESHAAIRAGARARGV